MNNENGFAKFLTLRNLIRVISGLLIIFFFVPSFMVSCSGESVKFSAASAMVGVKYEGERMSDPSPLVALLLILPIAMLVIWCLKNVLKDKIASIACLACAGVDLIMWFVVRMGVAANAEEILGTSKVLAGFVFNIIFVLLVIAANVLILINMIPADKPLLEIKGGVQQPNMQQNTYQSPTQDAAAQQAFCTKCGAPLTPGTKFCTKCGAQME